MLSASSRWTRRGQRRGSFRKPSSRRPPTSANSRRARARSRIASIRSAVLVAEVTGGPALGASWSRPIPVAQQLNRAQAGRWRPCTRNPGEEPDCLVGRQGNVVRRAPGQLGCSGIRDAPYATKRSKPPRRVLIRYPTGAFPVHLSEGRRGPRCNDVATQPAVCPRYIGEYQQIGSTPTSPKTPGSASHK